jgi:hypothetical protein
MKLRTNPFRVPSTRTALSAGLLAISTLTPVALHAQRASEDFSTGPVTIDLNPADAGTAQTVREGQINSAVVGRL